MSDVPRHPSWSAYTPPADLPPPVVGDPALPLVSVVTPSYNQARFIRDTIESVLAQEYPNIEYWVIDGQSTDGTVAILGEYERDPRFHWISEKDAGQSDAINKGWSRCRGEVVAWLNSDDTYLPGAVATQVEGLLRHADYGIVYGDVLYVDETGTTIYRGYGRPYDAIELLRLSIPAQPTTFIRRAVVDRVGAINHHFHSSMDSEYWLRAAKVTSFRYVPECIATYRLHTASKTVGGHQGFYTEWLAIAETFFSDPGLSRVYQDQRRRVFADIYGRIAAIEVEQGLLSEGARYLRKALAEGGLRLRMLKMIVLLLDRWLPFKVTPKLVQGWTYLQSKRRATLRT